MGDKRKEEKFKRKLEEMREKRRINKKLGKVKGLGEESDDDIETASSWVEKNRKTQQEKHLAEKRAQLLAEMDEEFGVGDLIQEEFGNAGEQGKKVKSYTSRDLRGLKVEHSEGAFQEGNAVIMTLKDASVLDDDQDTLMNMNILDREKADKYVELKKKTPQYQPYDESNFDDVGMLKPREILGKYNEEIDGEKKKSFVLDSGGQFDTSREDEVQRIRSNLKSQMVSLEMAKPQLAMEYYTSEEMMKFKKPKKKRRIRKRETLKADDLEALTENSSHTDHGSRSSMPAKSILKNAPQRRNDDAMDVDLPDPDYEAEILGPENDAESILFEEDEAQKELQLALERSRRVKMKRDVRGAESVAESLAAVSKQQIIERDEDQTITLDSTTEFCRALGEIPTYGSSGNREGEEDEEDEWKIDVAPEEEEPQSGWEWVRAQEEKKKQQEDEEKESNILDAEPMIGIGIAGALQLATKKGLFEAPKHKKEDKFVANIPLSSVGVIDEDKMRDEEKHRMRSGRDYDRDRDRDRGYGSSSLEKKGYKPDVKLEYVDDTGRALSQKEAFRFLSHKFHGKIPGKMKTEKRGKKVQEEAVLLKMSSGDTPLNTTALLIEKQRSAQSPFVILSGGGKTFTTGASIAKTK